MTQKLLTICVTTYNRSKITCELLDDLYHHPDVEYLLVDDGSEHQHQQEIEDMIHTRQIPVRFFKKENGGKLSALMYGLQYAQGRFFTDLDSDDRMEKKHVENILSGIQKAEHLIQKDIPLAGVCGLSESLSGKVVGDVFPEDNSIESYLKMRIDRKLKGNKVEVILTDELKKIHIPFFKGEKRMPTHALLFQFSNTPFLFVNTPFDLYTGINADSISAKKTLLRVSSCNSSRFEARVSIQQKKNYQSVKFYVQSKLNYIRYSLHGARPFLEKDMAAKIWSTMWIIFPLGLIAWLWDKIRR